MVTEAHWQHWKPVDFKVYLDVIVECFGMDRLMYGSDLLCVYSGCFV